MKDISTYLINEGLLDNLLFLLDTWFKNNETEKEEFTNICMQSLKNKTNATSQKDIKDYLSGTELEKNLKAFVNFIQGDVKMAQNTDYYYLFGKIIDNVMANKSKDNKYNTCKSAEEDICPDKAPKMQHIKDKIPNTGKPINSKAPQPNVKDKQGTTNVKTDSTFRIRSKKVVNNVEPIKQEPIKSKAPQNLKQHGTTATVDDNTLKT